MKTTLPELAELFKLYASAEENPQVFRQLASQIAILAAHTARVDARQKILDKMIAELAKHVQVIHGLVQKVNPQAPPEVKQQPTDALPVGEEGEAKAMAEKVMQETAAEVAAVAVSKPSNGKAEAVS